MRDLIAMYLLFSQVSNVLLFYFYRYKVFILIVLSNINPFLTLNCTGLFSGLVLDRFGLMKTGLLSAGLSSCAISAGFFVNSVTFLVVFIGVIFGKY